MSRLRWPKLTVKVGRIEVTLHRNEMVTIRLPKTTFDVLMCDAHTGADYVAREYEEGRVYGTLGGYKRENAESYEQIEREADEKWSNKGC